MSGRRRRRGTAGTRWGRVGESGPVGRMLGTSLWLTERREKSRGSQESGDQRAAWRSQHWSRMETLGKARGGKVQV